MPDLPGNNASSDTIISSSPTPGSGDLVAPQKLLLHTGRSQHPSNSKQDSLHLYVSREPTQQSTKATKWLQYQGVEMDQYPSSCSHTDTIQKYQDTSTQFYSDNARSIKQHVCETCGLAFSRLRSLKSHIKIHASKNKIVCKLCNLTFGRTQDLKRHAILHTGERPHICQNCLRSFSRLDALTRHRQSRVCISTHFPHQLRELAIVANTLNSLSSSSNTTDDHTEEETLTDQPPIQKQAIGLHDTNDALRPPFCDTGYKSSSFSISSCQTGHVSTRKGSRNDEPGLSMSDKNRVCRSDSILQHSPSPRDNCKSLEMLCDPSLQPHISQYIKSADNIGQHTPGHWIAYDHGATLDGAKQSCASGSISQSMNLFPVQFSQDSFMNKLNSKWGIKNTHGMSYQSNSSDCPTYLNHFKSREYFISDHAEIPRTLAPIISYGHNSTEIPENYTCQAMMNLQTDLTTLIASNNNNYDFQQEANVPYVPYNRQVDHPILQHTLASGFPEPNASNTGHPIHNPSHTSIANENAWMRQRIVDLEQQVDGFSVQVAKQYEILCSLMSEVLELRKANASK